MKVFTAKLEGRDPAGEKREANSRIVADRVDDLLEAYIAQHVSQRRSGGGLSRLLQRKIGKMWGGRSIHEITKRNVVEVIAAIEQRVAPIAANKMLKTLKTFLRWCVGRAVLDRSPADGVPLPAKELSRDRVLADDELARLIVAARRIGGPYGGIVELLALTAQRREEVACITSDEFDIEQRIWTLPKSRTKNGKPHIVHLSNEAIVVLNRANKTGALVFSLVGAKPFQEFSRAKRELDELSGGQLLALSCPEPMRRHVCTRQKGTFGAGCDPQQTNFGKCDQTSTWLPNERIFDPG
jgi:integrase